MISIGVGAIVFAIWFVTLFIGKSIGLSMILFIIPFSYFFIYILEKNNKIKNKKAKFLLIPILLLSSTYFIYNNLFFSICNLMVIPILLIAMILLLIGEKLKINKETIGTFFGFIFNPINYIMESLVNFIDRIKEKQNFNITNGEEKSKKIKKIFKALLITIPIVIVVTILLSTADEIFANIFGNLFENLQIVFKPLKYISSSMILVKIIIAAILFFYFMGLFYYICNKYYIEDEEIISNKKINDNFTIKIILVCLNIIYLVFCYIQIKSLFFRNTTLNYAHYARQGFFQLMVVSIINLVTIIMAKKKENRGENKTNKFINYMCLIMIFFTFIIVISAAVRMHFYESAYGYTILRLLVYCSLITEGILFIPTILYILDKNINLVKSYSIIIIAMYICMNFMNFDNIIAKRNIDRYFETGKIDMLYLKLATGTDAINQILRLTNDSKVSNEVKIEAEKYLYNLSEVLEEYKKNIDFRDFNISKLSFVSSDF